ncbi:MAG: hypothetical protein LBI33_03820, partial [Propionibacteriaceae bacterium]|nr:hypothetical protein [Propionibacteriaceae bacterium]
MSTEVLPETAEPQVAGPEPIATHIRRTAHGRYIVSTGENLLRPYLAWRIIGRMFRKVDPRAQWHNPVLFIVWVCSALTTVVAIADTVKGGPVYSGGLELPPGFDWVVAAWMWLTVLAANLAEALAEGQGRPHAAALKSMRETTLTRRVEAYDPVHDADARAARLTEVNSNDL